MTKRKIEHIPEPEGEEGPVSTREDKGVRVSSLALLQAFTYKGKAYTRRRTHPAGINALSAAGDEIITLAPDTIVTPA